MQFHKTHSSCIDFLKKVLLISFIAEFLIITVSCRDKGDPWHGQAIRLKELSNVVWKYRSSNNNAWPSSINDLLNLEGSSAQEMDKFYFIDPNTKTRIFWVVFLPKELIKGSTDKVIAAAPRVGGPGNQKFKRLVMLDSGVVTWITNFDVNTETKK